MAYEGKTEGIQRHCLAITITEQAPAPHDRLDRCKPNRTLVHDCSIRDTSRVPFASFRGRLSSSWSAIG